MEDNFTSPLLLPSSIALDSLSPVDRELFCKFGEGIQKQPEHATVIEAFEKVAKEHPQGIAATTVLEDGCLDQSSEITYQELNDQADKLAFLLQKYGAKNGDAVCLYMKRSVEMLVGIVAILKAGCCYVPQHVGIAPASQLINIADSTQTKVVLTTGDLTAKLPAFPSSVTVLAIDEVIHSNMTWSQPKLSRPVSPSDRCYIIFTSGTTGAPKGVQVTHGNVVNVLLTQPMDLGMAPNVRVSQILNIAFDMSAWEVLGCLMHGATLIIRNRSIADAVKHADVVISTPTVLGTLDAAEMSHVKVVAVAGEPCPRPLAAEWGQFATFHNSCGPTETTIINTAKQFDSNAEVLTIGKPTPNNTVYVLDSETLAPCRIGEVGEMWAGGLCVSAGYLNNPALTAERYLVDPFIAQEGYYMYKTGDLGRWDENGELEHFGRVDDQVKIRGFRVELDGVSAMAETAADVAKAVVLKVEDELVAYVSPRHVHEADVKAAVARHLPYYCVPSRVVSLDELPRTGNGKVDKRKLKLIDEYIPKTDLVQKENDELTPVTNHNSFSAWTNFGWAIIALVRRIGITLLAWK